MDSFERWYMQFCIEHDIIENENRVTGKYKKILKNPKIKFINYFFCLLHVPGPLEHGDEEANVSFLQ